MREEQMPGLCSCEVGSHVMADSAILASTPKFFDAYVLIKNTASQRGTLLNHVPHPKTAPF